MHTFAVADLEPFCAETFAYLDVPATLASSDHDIPTFFESLKRDKADPAILVSQIWPYHVVEDVLLYGIDGEGQGGEAFRARRGMEGGCVDCETGKVIEMRVRDEICRDVVAHDVGSVGAGGEKR